MRKGMVLWLGMALALVLAGCTSSPPPTVHQVSTLQALMKGAYEGQVPCRELPRYGTLGIGTFDGLDGEMIVLDGCVYKATADGQVIKNPPDTTPFANVVRFEPELVVRDVAGPVSLQELQALLDGKAGSKNLFYAVRVDGQFEQVKVRAIPRQKPPYPTLVEAAKQQRVYDLKNVRGTLVGFRFPEYVSGVNMPGWHLHFIRDDRQQGGHVLGLSGRGLAVQLQTVRRFEMTLPESGTFVNAELGGDLSKEIHAVEK